MNNKIRLHYASVAIVFIVYAPTNSGLQYARRKGIETLKDLYPNTTFIVAGERGEYIPRLIASANPAKAVFGITGEDLALEYLVQTGRFSQQTALNLQGKESYANTVFGLPTLCILGKEKIDFTSFKAKYGNSPKPDVQRRPSFRDTRVVIPKRYQSLIRSKVDLTFADVVCLEGKVDATAASDSTIDYAIDIVLTGSTCKKYGLGIVDVVKSSDGVLLQNAIYRES